MTYEERAEAIAEEKNEHRQVEKHFEELNRERLEEQLSDALTRLEDTLSENEQLKAQIECETEEKIEWADRCLEYENKYRQQNIELTYERKTNNELKGLLEKLLNPLCSSEDLQRAREYLKNQEIKNVFQFMQRGNELFKE